MSPLADVFKEGGGDPEVCGRVKKGMGAWSDL